jgi:hypothetical protein
METESERLRQSAMRAAADASDTWAREARAREEHQARAEEERTEADRLVRELGPLISRFLTQARRAGWPGTCLVDAPVGERKPSRRGAKRKQCYSVVQCRAGDVWTPRTEVLLLTTEGDWLHGARQVELKDVPLHLLVQIAPALGELVGANSIDW